MQCYPFSFEQDFSLTEECMKGFSSISLEKASHGRPVFIYLWHENGLGIKIQCVMHDLDSRLEVGSLIFKKTENNYNSLVVINLPNCFNGKLKLEKLLYVDENSIVESGVAMTTSTGEEMVIVSGAFPYTIEISIAGFNQDFEPEYPLTTYKRELINPS